MSREIKFRAWTDVKKMKFFSLYDALTYKPSGWIDTCIYMQYTGLKDRNDKEIYEGDIIKFYNGIINVDIEIGVLTFDGLMAYIDTGDRGTGDFITNYEKEEIEVIGNIHENPELIKT